MSRVARIRLLLIAAVAIIASSVWLAGETQRSAADAAAGELRATGTMLTAMLDQETGLRGYAATGDRVFLEPYERGRRSFELALAAARAGVAQDETDERELIERQERTARRWQDFATGAINALGTGDGPERTVGDAREGKRIMDRFRRDNRELQISLAEERTTRQRRAGSVSVGLIIALSLVFGLLGYLLVERGSRAEARRRERHAHFADVLQLSRTEGEAYDVVKRQLERTVTDAEAFVLNRNNSADRLEAATPVTDRLPLREALVDAAPESCLAIRMGALHHTRPEDETLLVCGLCGDAGGSSTCVPSLVGGEVIGSVLLMHPKPLGARERDYLRETVAEAAPIVANLRNLALAEMRAATDALTGLPNNRSAQETLKRMVAQADRTVAPLAVALIDLDHFKQINDTFGHAKGDDVLAAVGDAAGSAIRAGDFMARHGGEEFLLLLPNTDREGALLVAEKLRMAIARIKVSGVDRRITASAGVAVLPDDAGDGTKLLRLADRALYAAKERGRDRVETVRSDSPEPAEPSTAPSST